MQPHTGGQLDADAAMFLALMGDRTGVDPFVDPRDEILQYSAGVTGATRARFDYFRLGLELTRTVDQIADWAFGRSREGVSLLEFACGYGRNLRHLVRTFPPGNVTASDIDAEAVAFAVERFGVAGKVSVADPTELVWDERFDLIIVPSLFSHLPDATFGGWLKALHGLLTDRGVLAFSVHDASLTPGLDMATGIHFSAFSEASGRLDTEQYGTTHVTEDYIAEQVRRFTGQARYGRIPRGFWDHQDVYLTAGPTQKDPADFAFVTPVMGHVDTATVDGDQLRLAGWAHAFRPGLTLTVRVGDTLLHETSSFTRRGDVAHVRGDEFAICGFDVTLPLPGDMASRGDTVAVHARIESETRCLLALPLSTLAQAPSGVSEAPRTATAPRAGEPSPAEAFGVLVSSIRRELRARFSR